MQLRFAVGEVPEEHREEIAREEASYGNFLHIPMKVQNVILQVTMHGLTCLCITLSGDWNAPQPCKPPI